MLLNVIKRGSCAHATSSKIGGNGFRPLFLLFSVILTSSFCSSTALGQTIKTVSVVPNQIDFGRVRVGDTGSSEFKIVAGTGSSSIGIDSERYDSLLTKDYLLIEYADTTIRPTIALSQTQSIDITVRFLPQKEDTILWTDTIKSTLAPNATVSIRGIGLQPIIQPVNFNFGSIRLDSLSQQAFIPVRSIGNDTTDIYSIQAAGPNASDFTLLLDTIPTRTTPLRLEAAKDPESYWQFGAVFQPSLEGPETCYVQIHTDGRTVIDTLTGEGVNPQIVFANQRIDFGTISAPLLPGVAGDTLPQHAELIKNLGQFGGLLESLSQTDSTHFRFSFALPDSLPPLDSISGNVTFIVDQAGDFYDTVVILNKSKYPTVQYLEAHVRLGAAKLSDTLLDFDTVTGCDSTIRAFQIYDPYKVLLTFDSIALKGNSGGFSIDLNQVLPPINIPAGGTYPFKVLYLYPPDSGSGEQHMVLYFYERTGDAPERIDSIACNVVRRLTIATYAVPPSYPPSASDALPFRLPVYISGDWLGKSDLDNFSLTFQFSNDLFAPMGIDRTGSLTEKLPTDSDNITTTWDEATRTYTITLTNQHLSLRSDSSNTLLLTVLVHAFVTNDTIALVDTRLNATSKTCGASNAIDGIDTLFYANDCGDAPIQSVLSHQPILTDVEPVYPNPVTTSGPGAVAAVKLRLTCDAVVSWLLYDLNGKMLDSKSGIWLPKGTTTIEIPTGGLPAGSQFLRIQAINPLDNTSDAIGKTFVIEK